MRTNQPTIQDFFEALLNELLYISNDIKGDPASYYRILMLHDRLAIICNKPHAVRLKGMRND